MNSINVMIQLKIEHFLINNLKIEKFVKHTIQRILIRRENYINV